MKKDWEGNHRTSQASLRGSGSTIETNLKDVLHRLIKPEDLIWTKMKRTKR